MMKICTECGWNGDIPINENICPDCHWKCIRPMTNADYIRSMTDEQLANMINNGVSFCHYGACLDGETCVGCALKWLHQTEWAEY